MICAKNLAILVKTDIFTNIRNIMFAYLFLPVVASATAEHGVWGPIPGAGEVVTVFC